MFPLSIGDQRRLQLHFTSKSYNSKFQPQTFVVVFFFSVSDSLIPSISNGRCRNSIFRLQGHPREVKLPKYTGHISSAFFSGEVQLCAYCCQLLRRQTGLQKHTWPRWLDSLYTQACQAQGGLQCCSAVPTQPQAQSLVSGPAAEASPGNLSQLQILGCLPRPKWIRNF